MFRYTYIYIIMIDNLIAMNIKMIRVHVHIYKVLAGFDLSLQLDNVLTSDILVNFFLIL